MSITNDVHNAIARRLSGVVAIYFSFVLVLLFHSSLFTYIILIISFKFKKLFVLRRNNVIKTILRNIDIGNVIFPPVQKMGQDHPVHSLMADDHNIIRAPV